MTIGVRKTLFSLLLTTICAMSHSSEYIDKLISDAEKKYGIPEKLLKAISNVESRGNTSAMNVDGVPVYAQNAKTAITALRQIAGGKRYAFSVYFKDHNNERQYISGFYESESKAMKALQPHLDSGRKAILFNKKPIKFVTPSNTDICLLQINYRYHGKSGFNSVEEMFEPKNCINWAAKFLAKLIKRHDLDKGIGCYNGCGKSKAQQLTMNSYINKVKRSWARL